MSEKLEQAKIEYLEKLKQVKLIEAGIGLADLGVYTKYISASDEAEIERQAAQLVTDVKQHNSFGDVYRDDKVWRPFSD